MQDAIRTPNNDDTPDNKPSVRLSYSVKEFADIFGISESFVFKLLRTGIVARSKILNRTVITAAEVNRFATTLTEQSPS